MTCEQWQELDNECDTPNMVVYLTSLPCSASSIVGYITVMQWIILHWVALKDGWVELTENSHEECDHIRHIWYQ